MKRYLFLMLVVLMALGIKAQVAQIAVLSNEGKLSFFYGGSALIDAYEKAVDGDVITLSSGSFHAVDIKKAITVRGVGIVLENDKTLSPTYINGEMEVDLPEESADRQLIFEGLTFMEGVRVIYVKDVIFQKCEFLESVYGSDDPDKAEELKLIQYKFIHCLSTAQEDYFSIRYGNVSLINSVMMNLKTEGNKYQNFYIVNSIVRAFSYLYNCNFTNSVIFRNAGETFGSIFDSCSGSNCIVAGKDMGFKFGKNITFVDSVEGLFKEGTFYELTDKAAAILGTDGKQVGIYGGNFPFEATASGPKVKKFDVSPKTTADGKLSVDIEIAE